MSDAVNALVFHYADDARVALPPHTSTALVEAAELVEVPAAPYFCKHLLRWQNQWLPVLELQSLLNASPSHHPPRGTHVLVVAYQAAKNAAIEYGALRLVGLPLMVPVTDAMACDLPATSDYWSQIAISCFEYEGQPVPVLDTKQLFAAARA